MTDLALVIQSLREQSVRRGLRGRLEDFDVALCEDGQTVSVWAFYDHDAPLSASFRLPQPVSEIDNGDLRERLEAIASQKITVH